MLRGRLDSLSASRQRTLKLAACIAACSGMPGNPIFTRYLMIRGDSSWAFLHGKESSFKKLEEVRHI